MLILLHSVLMSSTTSTTVKWPSPPGLTTVVLSSHAELADWIVVSKTEILLDAWVTDFFKIDVNMHFLS